MNKPPFVRGLERLGDLLGKLQCLRHRDCPPAQPPLERLSRDILHDDARAAFELRDFIDLADERVIQRRGRPRFARESIHRTDIGWRSRQELQRDAPLEHEIVGEPHFAHGAFADHLDRAIPGRKPGGRTHVTQVGRDAIDFS